MPTSKDDFVPVLPPHMATMRDKSADEILADLEQSPIFMTEIVENDELEALRALAYEGTTLEVASGFKDRGNESFKEKGWEDAKEFYTKAIDVILNEMRKRQRDSKSDTITKEEKKSEVKVLEVCLVNRAACHLELRNYRSCCQDCGNALRINPKNIKACYRSSKALLALDRVQEAEDSCLHGLSIDPQNSALRSMKSMIKQRSEVVQAKVQEEIQRREQKKLARITRDHALRTRNIVVRKTDKPPDMEDACIFLTPDPLDISSSLCFPTLLLYPLHFQTDFIKAFDESQSISEHLAYIFPLPWDRDGVYTSSGIHCYIETNTGGLIKVGKKVSLAKVLATSNVEVVDELVKIFVVPQVDATTWISEFKQKKFRQEDVTNSSKN